MDGRERSPITRVRGDRRGAHWQPTFDRENEHIRRVSETLLFQPQMPVFHTIADLNVAWMQIRRTRDCQLTRETPCGLAFLFDASVDVSFGYDSVLVRDTNESVALRYRNASFVLEPERSSGLLASSTGRGTYCFKTSFTPRAVTASRKSSAS